MKELTVGVESIRYYPFWGTDVKNEFIGFARELFDNFGAAKGYNITFIPYRVESLSKKFYAGEFDLKFPDNPYWDGDNKKGLNIIYSDGVTEFIDGTLVESFNKDKGVERIKNLGTVRGFTPFDYFEFIDKGQVSVAESTAFHGLITGVLCGRIDAFYINVAVARYILEKLEQYDTFVFDPSLPHTRAKYSASSIKNPEAVQDLNDYLREEHKAVKALKEKYKVNLD